MSSTRLLQSTRFANFVGTVIRNRRLQFLRTKTPKLVNLGCGGNLLPHFFNVDYTWALGIDLCWDLRTEWPFESESVEGIFCEHTLEHFEWQDALNNVLPEALRILKPGAVIRISVPDAEKAVDSYLQARQDGKTSVPWDRPRHENPNRLHLTPMASVNNTFRRIFEPYAMGHKFSYDFQTLEYFLSLSGFTDIRRVDYLEGRDQRLLVDMEKRRKESLYAEAVKPS